MSSSKSLSHTFFNYVLLALYIVTGTLSNFDAIDILAPQWLYLCSVNILTGSYFLFFRRDHFSNAFTPLFRTYFIYIYIFYIVWNALSYFYAINGTETLINLPRLFNVFVAIVFCYFLIFNLSNKFVFISRLLLVFLSLELLAYYDDFITQFNLPNFSVLNLKGFAGNKNITAASIAFKVPFVLYILYTSNRSFLKIYCFLLLIPSVLAISIIEARSAILSSLIVFLLFILFQFYQIFTKSVTLKKGVIGIILVIIPYLLAYGFNGVITAKTKQSNLTETIGRISFTEKSSNGRFQYWSDAYAYVKSNPIFASGLGNWKIASISVGKEHISGYTVPYHAHNDFVHVFSETGLPGGIAYLSIFGLLSFYLVLMLYRRYKAVGELELQYFFLLLPLIVYGIDAGLNFPVARPLMQSSFAIFAGLVLTLYLSTLPKSSSTDHSSFSAWVPLTFNGLVLFFLLPSIIILSISYISLTQQGRLLYEFNNGKFDFTRAELDQIYDDFPNLTETAMPIKSMKARYYYLQGDREGAFEMLEKGQKDNPEIFFSENLKAQFYFQEQQLDSAYYYAKKAFEGLPNNMPHYDLYMKILTQKKLNTDIHATFERVRSMAGDTQVIWLIYLRSVAQTTSLGNAFAMEKAREGYNLFPQDDTIYTLYRILTYGQQRVLEAERLSNKGTQSYSDRDFENSNTYFKEAYDLDPLNYAYSLNAGLSLYESKKYEEAIKYFDFTLNSKRNDNVERALRYKGLSYVGLGMTPQACAVFNRLKNNYPKRMYVQEFQKYCFGSN